MNLCGDSIDPACYGTVGIKDAVLIFIQKGTTDSLLCHDIGLHLGILFMFLQPYFQPFEGPFHIITPQHRFPNLFTIQLIKMLL
jgi:hypothetical protein